MELNSSFGSLVSLSLHQSKESFSLLVILPAWLIQINLLKLKLMEEATSFGLLSSLVLLESLLEELLLTT